MILDEIDYSPLNTHMVKLDVNLLFDNNTRRDCFLIDVVEDVIVEDREQFSMILLNEPGRVLPSVDLSPNRSIVTIIDNEGMSMTYGSIYNYHSL